MPYLLSSVPPRVRVPSIIMWEDSDDEFLDSEYLDSDVSSPSLSPSQTEFRSVISSSDDNDFDSPTAKSNVHQEAMDILLGDTSAYTTAIKTDDVLAKFMFHSGDNFCWMWISIKLGASFDQALALHTEVDLIPQWNPVLQSVKTIDGEGERQMQLWTKCLPLGLFKGELVVNADSITEHGKWVARFYPMTDSELALLPSTKLTREYTDGAMTLIPISAKETLFLQCVKFTLPFSPSAFIIRNTMPTCMKAYISPIVSSAKKVAKSKSCPWKQRVSDNVDGRYTFTRQATIDALGQPLAPEIASVIPNRRK